MAMRAGNEEARTMFKKVAIAILTVLLTTTSAYAQGYGVGTPLEAKKMVEKAVQYIKVNGEENALKEFNNPNGKFQWRDLYVFAYDLKGVMMGHPNPQLIGRNLYQEPDIKGKLFRKEIVYLASNMDSGWVDYTYLNQLTQHEEQKITYFQKVGNLIVCCGAYLP
jgi:cytochrome c